MDKIKIGITHGDINGVSYEIILKALASIKPINNNIFILYGSPKVFSYYRKLYNSTINSNTIQKAEEAKPKVVNIINCNSEDIKVEIGKSTNTAGLSSYQALDKASQDLQDKKIDLLITAPINKSNVNAAGFKFSGHTDFLAEKFSDNNNSNNLMILMNDFIKIGLVSCHVPISEVPSLITKKRILNKLQILNESLKNDFLINNPKIAVLGLNPHSGDNGCIGTEENDIIIPAINEANEKGILCFGPFPADGFFGASKYNDYDAVLAMYHDQGLAPFKIIAFDTGVNYTAGLNIVRTSPAHGTAYDIAGKGIADENSFRQAIYSAVDIYNNRNGQKDLMDNKLKINSTKEINQINKNAEQ